LGFISLTMTIIAQLVQKIDDAHLWEAPFDLPRNAFLKTAGTIDTKTYYIIEGSLRIFFAEPSGEKIIRLGYKQNIIGALDAFISGQPSPFYIQAIKKCRIKAIPKKPLMQLVHANKENMLLWQACLEALVYQQIEREKDLLIDSPHERYQRVLQRSPHLFQEIPNKYIAAYLRMTPETLSRIKKS